MIVVMKSVIFWSVESRARRRAAVYDIKHYKLKYFVTFYIILWRGGGTRKDPEDPIPTVRTD